MGTGNWRRDHGPSVSAPVPVPVPDAGVSAAGAAGAAAETAVWEFGADPAVPVVAAVPWCLLLLLLLLQVSSLPLPLVLFVPFLLHRHRPCRMNPWHSTALILAVTPPPPQPVPRNQE